MRPGVGQAEVLGDAAAAVDLDRAVDDVEGHVGGHHLDHGDLGTRRLVADLVHHVGGFQRQQARLLDLDARARDCIHDHALLGERLAEGGPVLGARANRLERALGDADQAHAVMDAPGAEAPLGDLEAAALAEDHVLGRHPHVLEVDLEVTVGGVVVAVDRERAHQRHARRVARHQDLGLLLVALGAGVGLAHEDEDLAALVAGARDPPLAPVEHVVVAVALDA